MEGRAGMSEGGRVRAWNSKNGAVRVQNRRTLLKKSRRRGSGSPGTTSNRARVSASKTCLTMP